VPRLAFEDFEVGQVIACGPRTVTADDIVAFATQFDPQPFHVDAEAGERSIYGGLIASGWHTASLAMRMACDAYLLDSSSAGSPGIDELRWLQPVRAGDTIRVDVVMVETRPSKSKPDRGVVVAEWRVYNQHDVLVMTMRGMGMFLRREAPAVPTNR
jgi:acyl dehydratase